MPRIGIVGRIVAGRDLGSYVKVERMPGDPTAFYVFVGRDRAFRTDAGDYWVEDLPSVEEFFRESGWEVVWETD
ncbi:hypothetical protein [Streptomyces sedi]|uniref:Uncharacterized protein n=1 Tax=Streptomyces sedi TaxID=555059 RepID=A0A5C4V1H8_9ACTN|nr:hypothetical protein [Streptomyces sedi]TNM29840.1 hypothetical protein FH715_13950 [Streptomyces sedi]